MTIAGQTFLVFDAERAEGVPGPAGALIGRARHALAMAFREGRCGSAISGDRIPARCAYADRTRPS